MYVLPPLDGALALLLVGVGFSWLGRDDEASVDIDQIAARLDTRPTEQAVLQRLDDLSSAVDNIVSQADLDQHATAPPAPDASSVEKVEALAQALDRNEISVGRRTRDPRGGATQAGDGESVVADAALDLQAERVFDSETATDLADALANPDEQSARSLRRTLDETVSGLNAYARLEDALADGVPVNDQQAQQLASELADRDPVLDAVAEVLRAMGDASEGDQEDLRELLATVLDAYEDDTGATLAGNSLLERTRSLVAHVESKGFGDDDAALETAGIAGRVDETLQPEGEPAQRLLDALAATDSDELEPALRRAVEDLEFAATTRGVVGSVDRDDVLASIDDVAAAVEDQAGPTADALQDRLDELEGAVQRAHDSNQVVPYWVQRELEFYDATLLPALQRAREAGSADGDLTGLRDEVESRRERIQSHHVEAKADHNHSIPLHFLDVVDDLVAEADDCEARGQTETARGWLDAARELLTAIEQLYEQNQYSVMLRRLRG